MSERSSPEVCNNSAHVFTTEYAVFFLRLAVADNSVLHVQLRYNAVILNLVFIVFLNAYRKDYVHCFLFSVLSSQQATHARDGGKKKMKRDIPIRLLTWTACRTVEVKSLNINLFTIKSIIVLRDRMSNVQRLA
jgi:hypothetical protein